MLPVILQIMMQVKLDLASDLSFFISSKDELNKYLNWFYRLPNFAL